MNYRNVTWIACLACWIATAAANLLAQPPQSTEITFRFAPPEGTVVTQKTVITRERIVEGGARQTTRSESEQTVSYRKVEDAYVLTFKPLSMKTQRDGKEIADPISGLLKDVTVTYRVSADGQIQGIEGYAGLLERTESRLPPEVVAALRPYLNEQALINKDIAEWNGRIGDFVGGTVEIGQKVEAESAFPFPNGEQIVFRTQTSFPALRPCAAGTCILVRTIYDSDSEGFDSIASELASGVSQASGSALAGMTASDSRISGSASRLIDPQTMLIYEEKMSRTLSFTVEMPGQDPARMTTKEVRTYSFEYR